MVSKLQSTKLNEDLRVGVMLLLRTYQFTSECAKLLVGQEQKLTSGQREATCVYKRQRKKEL